jgi:hypothetical protein
MLKTSIAASILGLVLLLSAGRQKPVGEYTRAAERFESEARDYDALAERYRRQPTADEWRNSMSGRTVGHSAHMASLFRRKAEKMRRLAAIAEGRLR